MHNLQRNRKNRKKCELKCVLKREFQSELDSVFCKTESTELHCLVRAGICGVLVRLKFLLYSALLSIPNHGLIDDVRKLV